MELLISELKSKYKLAVLSRGYKRKTRGFRLASEQDDSLSLGDEPFQYVTKYGKEIKVAVGEDRMTAIPELLFRDDALQVIILDDAYQHRSVRPQLNILLNDYNRPFYRDFVLPAGLLRESRKHADRADMVIVTKCPEDLDDMEMNHIESQIRKYTRDGISVHFTGIKYLKPKPLYGTEQITKDVYLFTGIANTTSLENYLNRHFHLLGHKKFADHHSYTEKDLNEIITSFEAYNSDSKCLLTTEKDMVRLLSMHDKARFLMDYPVFYLPIELYFLRNGDFFANQLQNEVMQGLNQIEVN